MDLRRSTGGGGVRALPRYGGLATRDHDGGRRENCPYGKGSGTQGGRDGSCPEEAGRKTAERSLLAPSWGATGISARQPDSPQHAVSFPRLHRNRHDTWDGSGRAASLGDRKSVV